MLFELSFSYWDEVDLQTCQVPRISCLVLMFGKTALSFLLSVFTPCEYRDWPRLLLKASVLLSVHNKQTYSHTQDFVLSLGGCVCVCVLLVREPI